MSDINLLPEEKRIIKKNGHKKNGRATGIEYTNPPKEKSAFDKKEGGSIMESLRKLVNRMKKKEFLKPKEVRVDRTVTEGYGDVLSKEKKQYKTTKHDNGPSGKMSKIKIVEPIKPKLSFWQKWKMSREEKQRKSKMLKMQKSPKDVLEKHVLETRKEPKQPQNNKKNFFGLTAPPPAPAKKETKISLPKKAIKNNKKEEVKFSKPSMDLSEKKKLEKKQEKERRKEEKRKEKERKRLEKERKKEEAKKRKGEKKHREEKKIKKKNHVVDQKKKPKKLGLTTPLPEEGKDGVEVNLLPRQVEIREVTPGKYTFVLLNTALATLVVAGLLYWGFVWYMGSVSEKINTIGAEIKTTQQEIVGSEEKVQEALAFRRKIFLTNAILSNHIHWSNFYDFLERNTYDKVYFLDMQGEEDGRIILSGVAEDFASVGKQLEIFEQAEEYVQRANVDMAQLQAGEAEAGEKSVYFNLYLQLKPGLLK